MVIPNIVHYNWYAKKTVTFQFHRMLAILSAHKHVQPDAILFHTNNPPSGKYWEMLTNLTGFKVIKRAPPKIKKLKHDTDYSDLDRLLLLREYGGIYLDMDVMVTKSFDDLRQYPCTVGLETETTVCGGIIICSRDSIFLALWIDRFFTDYRSDIWAYNSGKVPSKLAQMYPDYVHIEKTSLHRPSYKEMNKIWGSELYNWKDNYAIHTWIRLHGRANPDPENIKRMNTTYGQLARLVYYGSSEFK